MIMTLRDGSKLFKPQFCPVCGGRVLPDEVDHSCEKCGGLLPYGSVDGNIITIQVMTDVSKIEEIK